MPSRYHRAEQPTEPSPDSVRETTARGMSGVRRINARRERHGSEQDRTDEGTELCDAVLDAIRRRLDEQEALGSSRRPPNEHPPQQNGGSYVDALKRLEREGITLPSEAPEQENSGAERLRIAESAHRRTNELIKAFDAMGTSYDIHDVWPIVQQLRHDEMLLKELLDEASAEPLEADRTGIAEAVETRRHIEFVLGRITQAIEKSGVDIEHPLVENIRMRVLESRANDLRELAAINDEVTDHEVELAADAARRHELITQLSECLATYEADVTTIENLDEPERSYPDVLAKLDMAKYLVTEANVLMSVIGTFGRERKATVAPVKTAPTPAEVATIPDAHHAPEETPAEAALPLPEATSPTAEEEKTPVAAREVRDSVMRAAAILEKVGVDLSPYAKADPETERRRAEAEAAERSAHRESVREARRTALESPEPESNELEAIDARLRTVAEPITQMLASVERDLGSPTTYANRERFDDALITLSRQYADLAELRETLDARQREFGAIIDATKDHSILPEIVRWRQALAARLFDVEDLLHGIQTARSKIQASLRDIPAPSEGPERAQFLKDISEAKHRRIEALAERLEVDLKNKHVDDPAQFLNSGPRQLLNTLSHAWFLRGLRNTSDMRKAELKPNELRQIRDQLQDAERRYLQERYAAPSQKEARDEAERRSAILRLPEDVTTFDLWRVVQAELGKTPELPVPSVAEPEAPKGGSRKDPLATRVFNALTPNHAIDVSDIANVRSAETKRPSRKKTARARVEQSSSIDRVIDRAVTSGISNAREIYGALIKETNSPEASSHIPRLLEAMTGLANALQTDDAEKIHDAQVTLSICYHEFENENIHVAAADALLKAAHNRPTVRSGVTKEIR